MSDACEYDFCCETATTPYRGETFCQRHAILKRAGWRCEAIVPDRRPWKDGELIRCPVMGSEIDVYGGEARCPRHHHAVATNGQQRASSGDA